MMELHLVADTNLFFECKTLDQLPWADLGGDPIVILLTKPVLDEIDKHKKANGRTRARALEVFGNVRSMLKSSVSEMEICPASPRVVLRLMPNVVPDASLKDQLDYTKTDERLIGIVAALNLQASGYSVALFTDDTGPAATANGLSVPCLMIEEGWRRPASETTEEKEIRELRKDLATYRAQEPTIVIRPCEPGDASNVVEVTRRIAQPLSEAEIEGILAALKLKHPLVTDFTPPASVTTKDELGSSITIEYHAPLESEILNYRDVAYPRWIDQCRAILAKLHEGRDEIEGPVVLRWAMANEGTRPASQVRVEFEAKGPLALQRLVEDEDVDETSEKGSQSSVAAVPRFPSAPQPPAFQQHVTTASPPPAKRPLSHLPNASLLKASGLFDARTANSNATLARFMGDHERLAGISAIEKALNPFGSQAALEALRGAGTASSIFQHIDPVRIPSLHLPKRHDPEAFYYDWPAVRQAGKGALTCDLWRHKIEDEVFVFEVVFTKDGQVRGTVECTVHAENLTKPVQAKVIVGRTIEHVSVLEIAEAMVGASTELTTTEVR